MAADNETVMYRFYNFGDQIYSLLANKYEISCFKTQAAASQGKDLFSRNGRDNNFYFRLHSKPTRPSLL